MYPTSRTPRRPPTRSKVQVRDLGTAGVKDTKHTSIRLDAEDKILLRRLTSKVEEETGVPATMSSVIRRLIRKAANEEGIQP